MKTLMRIISVSLLVALFLTFTAYANYPNSNASYNTTDNEIEPPKVVIEYTDDRIAHDDNTNLYDNTTWFIQQNPLLLQSISSDGKYDSLPDGIYAFENLGNRGRYMDVQQNQTVPGYHMQQYAFDISPSDSYSASGLYSVKQIGESGRYVIRLMLNTNLTFEFSGNDVLTKTIPSSDEDVNYADTFYIKYNNGGYTIRPALSSYYVGAKDTLASGATGAPDSFLSKYSISSAGDRVRWIVKSYHTYIPNGVYAFENLGNIGRWMDVEHDERYPGYHIQQYGYSDPPTSSFSRGGLFKISRIGLTDRYVIRSMLNNRLTFSFANNEVLTKSIPENDSMVLTTDTFKISFYNGSYLIIPYGCNECVCAHNTSASGSSGAPDSFLTTCQVSSAGPQAKWSLYKYAGNERNGYVLSVPIGLSENGLECGMSMSIGCITWSTIINANNQDITTSSTALVSLQYNSDQQEASIYALQSGTVILNINIKQHETVVCTLTYSFQTIARTPTLIAIQDTSHTIAHDSYFASVRNSLQIMGYNSVSCHEDSLESYDGNDFLNDLCTSNYLIIMSHGEPTQIQLTYSRTTIGDVMDMPSGSLTDLELVVLASCYTAQGYPSRNFYNSPRSPGNFAEALSIQGANNVIGFKDAVFCAQIIPWMEQFFYYLSQGQSYTNACDNADDYIKDNYPKLKKKDSDPDNSAYYSTDSQHRAFIEY